MGLKALISDALFGEAYSPAMSGEQKYAFKTAMERGILDGNIKDLTDVATMYRAVTGFRSTEIGDLPGLRMALSELFINAVSKNLGAVVARAREFLVAVEAMAPYDGLPALERSLMVDISASVDRGDIEGAKQKMLHLANSIQDRSRALRRNRAVTWWSSTIAVVSVILNVVQILLQLQR